jgi:hypothetical protein
VQELETFDNHLEFLGYTIEKREKSHRATHDRYLNFTYRPFQGGTLFSMFYEGSDFAKSNPLLFHAWNGGLNAKAVCARFYIDSDGDFVMESWLPGRYDKQTFSTFVEQWQADGRRLMDDDESSKYLA